MAERQPPSSRDGGERRSSSYREQNEYRRTTTSQSRDGYRQPTSQSRDGYRQPASQSRDGYRQPASQSRSSARPASPQSREGYRQPAPRSGSGRQGTVRRNDVIRCENCGEDYSVTYKRCPFCDERPSRGGVTGKRVANTRGGGYGRPASALKTATWIASFVVVIVAMVIVYRFMGAPLFHGGKDPNNSSQSSNNSSASGSGTSAPGNTGDTSNTPAVHEVQSIILSQSEFTLDAGGVQQLTAGLLPEGAEGEVTWSSSNESAATVDAMGIVTNVNAGTTNTQVTITASCGGVTAEAKVYCKPSAVSVANRPGKVVNAPKGVNIRSGPGTDYDKVASAANGTTVTILSEENGWYKVSYGNSKTGYIRKDYISVG